MTRVLLVAQEKGGSGKTTIVRAVAEAIPGVDIVEIDGSHRLVEFDSGKKSDRRSSVRFFPMRASHDEIERTGGLAARGEFDDVVNALGGVRSPAVVDIGANTSAAFFAHVAEHAARLKKKSIELGVVVVVTAEPSALAHAADLIAAASPWASAMFVVENRLHGAVECDRSRALAGSSPVGTFEKQIMEPAAVEILQARGLGDIQNLDADALEDEFGMARGSRIVRDLERFRHDAMVAVQAAAEWVVA